MRLKTIALLVLSGLLLGALLAPGAAGKPKKKKSGPVVVGTDPADDWGSDTEAALAPLGNALGLELVEAELGMADKATVNFVIKVNSLPPAGGTPEIARYVWAFTVDGKSLELDGKFTNYSRGACDPTAGTCPPPRDPGMSPFLLRGNCSTVGTTVVCEEVGIVNAAFDAGAGTITIPVPLELIGAKPGSVIGGGASGWPTAGSVVGAASAYVTPYAAPHDSLVVDKTFKIPRK